MTLNKVISVLILTAVPILARLSSATDRLGPLPDSIKVVPLPESQNECSQYAAYSEFPWERLVDSYPGCVFSPDGLHLVSFDNRLSSVALVYDGVRGKEYRGITGGAFSAEGGHVLYLASPSAGGRAAFVLDGAEYPIDKDLTLLSSPILSADGRHFAYVASNRSPFRLDQVVVTDQGPGSPYDSVSMPSFSWDGERLAYRAVKGIRHFIVVNGVESPSYLSAGLPEFDLTGRHIVYSVGTGIHRSLLRDGEPVAPGEPGAYNFISTRDDRHHAYIVRRMGNSAIVIDGHVGRAWDSVLADTSLFSPDGAHTVYWGRRGGSWTLIVDDEEHWFQERFPLPARFTTDSRKLVYVRMGEACSTVMIEPMPVTKQSPTRSRDQVFDPDCWQSVVPVLGPGGRVAYTARRRSIWVMVVDGVEGPEFRDVGNPAFSRDGLHVAYRALIGPTRTCVVADGISGPEFNAIGPNGPTYLPDGSFEYLARKGTTWFRVRHVPQSSGSSRP